MNIPEEFLCPLTLDIMKNPVVSKQGLTFEYAAIAEWLDIYNDSCPLTREELDLPDLTPGKDLKRRIKEWVDN